MCAAVGGILPRPNTTPMTSSVLLNVSWDVFKVTPEQMTKLARVANEYLLETVSTPGGGFVPPAKVVAANEKLTKAVADILTPEQVKRMEEVQYQLIALRGIGVPHDRQGRQGAGPEGRPGGQDHGGGRRRTTAVGRGGAALGGVNSFGTGAWIAKLNEKTRAKATAVLTDGQRAKWKELTGDPVPNLRSVNTIRGNGTKKGSPVYSLDSPATHAFSPNAYGDLAYFPGPTASAVEHTEHEFEIGGCFGHEL